MAAPLETYSVQFFLRLRLTRAERYPALRQPRQERRKPVSADRQRSTSPPEPAWRRVTPVRTLCSRDESCFFHYKEASLCTHFAATRHPMFPRVGEMGESVPASVSVPISRNMHIRTIKFGDAAATPPPYSPTQVGARNVGPAIAAGVSSVHPPS